ncbi:MAG: hypothetical protein AB2541_16735 [Candidatus Thiodiazotropha sp.]
MNPAIREILQYITDHPEMTTRSAVEAYFDQIIWSIEKEEWENLTEEEKQWFVARLNLANERPPKGP